MDIFKIIDDLKTNREIFHSEADFQHELAWHIRKFYPNSSIRLEKPFYLNERIYVDIYVYNNSRIAIELKYKTQKKKGNFVSKGEEFKLATHAAINLCRYDYLKDIGRLEKLKQNGEIDVGYSIFLTNVSSYWNKHSKRSTLSEDFYISQDENITGELSWVDNVKESSVGKKRLDPIRIKNSYLIDWKIYSEVENNEFKILISKIA